MNGRSTIEPLDAEWASAVHCKNLQQSSSWDGAFLLQVKVHVLVSVGVGT